MRILRRLGATLSLSRAARQTRVAAKLGMRTMNCSDADVAITYGISLPASDLTMNAEVLTPRRIGRWGSIPLLWQIGTDVMRAMRRLHRAHGPYVILTYPHSRRSRPRQLGIVADSGLYRTMFADGERWRNINIVFRGLRNHASHRLTVGFTRLRGARHAHYRRLIAKPLSRVAVAGMSEEMAVHAKQLVDAWPPR